VTEAAIVAETGAVEDRTVVAAGSARRARSPRVRPAALLPRVPARIGVPGVTGAAAIAVRAAAVAVAAVASARGVASAGRRAPWSS
jgi:hypothetical protein